MQDFIGDHDQLVDTCPKYGNKPGNGWEIHLQTG